MTVRQLDNRIKKLKEMEELVKGIEKEAEAIREDIKRQLEAEGLEELKTNNFIVRLKEITSSRFDGNALKAVMPELYSRYTKQTTYRRLTIA